MILPAKNPELADSILQTVDQVCTELSVPYFISGGTLLGFYRDGGYIPWHHDIDISMVSNNYYQLLEAFYHYGLISDSYGEFEGCHFWKGDMLLDIIWVEPQGFYESYDEIEHNGIAYPAPYPIEEYLEWKYGPTWRTPMREGEYTLQHEH